MQEAGYVIHRQLVLGIPGVEVEVRVDGSLDLIHYGARVFTFEAGEWDRLSEVVESALGRTRACDAGEGDC